MSSISKRHSLKTSRLTDEELLEFKEIFQLVDKDGGGSISTEELGELMNTLGITASQEEIDSMIMEIDEDSNGEIDFEEFVAVMSRKINATYTEESVKNAFKYLKNENIGLPDGCIHYKQLEQSILNFSKEKNNSSPSSRTFESGTFVRFYENKT